MNRFSLALCFLAVFFSDGSLASAAPVQANIADSTVVARRLLVEEGPSSFYPEAPSPDGRYLVGVDRRKPWVLGIKDIRTNEIQRITTKAGFPTGWVEESIFSPDGKTIAFTWGESRQRYLLSTIRVDGSAERTLFTPNDLLEYATPEDWSPDGRELLTYLYARDKTTQIALISAVDGTIRSLKSLEWRRSMGLRMSPDGKAVAFDMQLEKDAGARDIFVLATDGSREIRITNDRQPKRLLGWAPDGGALFYTRRDTIWRVHLNENRQPGKTGIVRADVFGLEPVRLQGPTLYYFQSTVQQSVVSATVDFETGRVRAPLTKVVAGGGIDSYSPVRWSADGRQLAFIRRTPSAGISQVTLALRHVVSGEEPRMPLELEQAQLERWGPGDRTIVMRGWQRGKEAMYEVDLASGTMTRIGDAPGPTPRFASPDGRFEYYIKRSAGAWGASVMQKTLATGAERELHRVRNPNAPSLSPDGKTFAFRYPDTAGVQILTLMSTSGERPAIEVRGLPKENNHEWATWTPDSRFAVRVFGAGNEHDEVWIVSAETGEARRVLQSKNGLRSPSVTADGRIAFGSHVGGEQLELWVMENLRSSVTPERRD